MISAAPLSIEDILTEKMAFAELISWAKDRPKWHVGRPAGTGAVRRPQSVLPALRRRLAARHGRNREQPPDCGSNYLPPL
jgi:hypothetical protein